MVGYKLATVIQFVNFMRKICKGGDNMELSRTQKEMLKEILAMGNYINLYQEISESIRNHKRIAWKELADKYQVSISHCIEIFNEVLDDIKNENKVD